jgi:hypothetical protein
MPFGRNIVTAINKPPKANNQISGMALVRTVFE